MRRLEARGFVFPVLLGLLLSTACANYAFIGAWTRQPAEQPTARVYVNTTQRVRLTIFDPRWRVFEKPGDDLTAAFGDSSIWGAPNPAGMYTILVAGFSPVVLMHLVVEPLPSAVTIDEYLALARPQMKKDAPHGMQILEIEKVERHGRSLIVLEAKLTGDRESPDAKMLSMTVVESDRALRFTFLTPAPLYESKVAEFWTIVDSFESLSAAQVTAAMTTTSKPTCAEVANTSSVAYLNMGRAINEVEAGRSAKRKLMAEFTAKQEELDRLQRELKAEMERFESESSGLSEEQRNEGAVALESRFSDLQNTYAKLQKELLDHETVLTDEITAKVRPAGKVTADRLGLAIVVELPPCSGDYQDITVETIAEVDRQASASD